MYYNFIYTEYPDGWAPPLGPVTCTCGFLRPAHASARHAAIKLITMKVS